MSSDSNHSHIEIPTRWQDITLGNAHDLATGSIIPLFFVMVFYLQKVTRTLGSNKKLIEHLTNRSQWLNRGNEKIVLPDRLKTALLRELVTLQVVYKTPVVVFGILFHGALTNKGRIIESVQWPLEVTDEKTRAVSECLEKLESYVWLDDVFASKDSWVQVHICNYDWIMKPVYFGSTPVSIVGLAIDDRTEEITDLRPFEKAIQKIGELLKDYELLSYLGD